MFSGLYVEGYHPNAVCPVCAFNYTHMKEIRTKPDAWQYMQSVIVFKCEESHRFELVIEQHRG